MKRNGPSPRGNRPIPVGTPPDLSDWPLIFISHDSRDASLAEAFELLLADASGGMLKAFRSSDRRGSSGIEFGADWYATIMARLDQASDVVALLTPRSIERPWILYEVGVARGKLDHPAFGVALGLPLDAITGPFAQFQNCGDDEDSLTKLVVQLIKRNPKAEPRPEAVSRQVVVFRERIATMEDNSGQKLGQDTSSKLFEEVKAMFEILPDRLLSALNERIPSLVDPIGPHWSEWINSARRYVADMWTANPSNRAGVWALFTAHIQEYVPRLTHANTFIARGLLDDSEELYRRGATAFEQACEPYLNSPSKIDQEAANVLRSSLTLLRHWLDTQPWGSKRDLDTSDR